MRGGGVLKSGRVALQGSVARYRAAAREGAYHAGGEKHAATLVRRPDALQRCQLPRRALVGGRSPPPVHVAVRVGVRLLTLRVQPRAVCAVLQLECRAKHDRQRDRFDAAEREVAHLDDCCAARLVPKLCARGGDTSVSSSHLVRPLV